MRECLGDKDASLQKRGFKALALLLEARGEWLDSHLQEALPLVGLGRRGAGARRGGQGDLCTACMRACMYADAASGAVKFRLVNES